MSEEKTEKNECRFLQLIQQYSGLTLSASHRDFIMNFICERKKELSLSDDEYCRKLEEDLLERKLVIDEAAINETYFFREESQFDFLKETYFPEHRNVVIWSAACSSGEEAISLYALAKACDVDAKVYASDIDEKALSQIQGRSYSANSFRNEGSPYLKLLGKLGAYHPKSFTMSRETLESLSISKFNLVGDDSFPMQEESVDLLFLRNVFIYFTKETRKAVLIKMARALKNHGLLFLSVNEIASVDCEDDMPFVKENDGSVYYLKKVSMEEKQKIREERLNKKEVTASRLKEMPPNKRSQARPSGKTPLESLSDKGTSEERQCSIPEFYKKIRAEISSGKTESARKMLESHTFRPLEMEHEQYIKGLIFEAEENDAAALDCFLRSSILNPKFWPASYSLGMAYKKLGNDKNMEKAFISCSNALKSYIQNQEICYNEVVDSFSPDYFLELCQTQLAGGR